MGLKYELKSLAFEVWHNKKVFAFGPDQIPEEADGPEVFQGETILIDGKTYLVEAVELFKLVYGGMAFAKRNRYNHNFSLLVKEIL